MADRNYRNYGNVAIKREQRLLADYAEHKQRKDCESGLIIGKEKGERLGSLKNLGNLGIILNLLNLLNLTSHPPYSTHSHHANYHLDTCLLTKAIPSLTHPQAHASAGDVPAKQAHP